MFAKFLADDSGATAIEYGLIGTLISIGIIVGATQLGDAVNGKFSSIASSVDTAID